MILQKYDFSSKSQLSVVPLQCSGRCLWYCKSTIFQANHNRVHFYISSVELFVILQKYDFSSKSQLIQHDLVFCKCCLWYCKSTIFQANHNEFTDKILHYTLFVILQKYDFSSKSQLQSEERSDAAVLFVILQKYDFSSKSQLIVLLLVLLVVVCDTAKVRFFKQITTTLRPSMVPKRLFVILQKYDFSSKSQQVGLSPKELQVVCDTAKVRFFKQITTTPLQAKIWCMLFVILQKYDFSSKSQRPKSEYPYIAVVCDTAKVRFFKQITTGLYCDEGCKRCLWYCKSTIFQANHNLQSYTYYIYGVVCDTAKVRFFKQITTCLALCLYTQALFVILQKYDFSSKSQPLPRCPIIW